MGLASATANERIVVARRGARPHMVTLQKVESERDQGHPGDLNGGNSFAEYDESDQYPHDWVGVPHEAGPSRSRLLANSEVQRLSDDADKNNKVRQGGQYRRALTKLQRLPHGRGENADHCAPDRELESEGPKTWCNSRGSSKEHGA